ncbi:MAG TPA: alkaline phosphatase D family protein [Terriglobales bacterium]|nr:alkaline phosphatase D family protein [Terriglobales bacterium]
MPRLSRRSVATPGLLLPTSRRGLLRTGVLGGGTVMLGLGAAALFPKPSLAKLRDTAPVVTHGVQSGDIGLDSGVVWARADRPARMIVDYALTESFKDSKRQIGPAALQDTDFTARLQLGDLPAGQDVFFKVTFQDLGDLQSLSEPVIGRFRTAPGALRDVTFIWGGDVVGQGWGINPAIGGMTIWKEMANLQPDFFIHSGDSIYADGVLKDQVTLPDGSIWKNVTSEEKSKVAETLDEYRGNYKYNLLDENLRGFNATVPILAQWDDHETRNNWYPNQILDDDRYKIKSVALLSANAGRAWHEYMPLRLDAQRADQVYRVIHYGPSLDVFMLDQRSYRGDNSRNRQDKLGPDSAFMGAEQIRWLKQQLLASKATWKVLASDMPISLVVPDPLKDGTENYEAIANRDNGAPLGRELEIADLLRFMKQNGVKNTVWLTADVHYTAAHYYDPDKAQFQDFEPFWEFVSGPINAGTFGPNELDATFGPQLKFQKAPDQGQANLSPAAEMQFFGHVKIDAATEVMTVTLKDLKNRDLYKVDLPPVV